MIINDLILVLKDDIINDDTLYFGCKVNYFFNRISFNKNKIVWKIYLFIF